MKNRSHTLRNLGLWLIPFALALVLLFSGCAKPAASPAPAESAPPVVSELQEVVTESEAESETEETKAEETETEAEETEVEETEEEAKEAETKEQVTKENEANVLSVEEDGEYNTKDEVALYIHTYGKLPKNYITKKKAQELGWVSKEGNLWKVAPGKSIGGDHFGNYEKLLPEKKGRKYTECDIDFDGKRRNAKRIIFSNDGLIYYTDDHYNTFEQLY